MHGDAHWMWFFFPFGWIFTIIVFGALFRFVFFRRGCAWGPPGGWSEPRLDAKAILDRRLASGEITEDEHERLSARLKRKSE